MVVISLAIGLTVLFVKSAFMAAFTHASVAALKRGSCSENLKLSTANIACSVIRESGKILILIDATVAANIGDDIAERCITITVLVVLR